MGLANPVSAPFPHDPSECDELLQVLRRHRVIARHGDIFDPLHYSEDRDASSLGDALVIELLGRFLNELEHGLADGLPAATLHGLREIDRIRPILAIPAWIDGLLQRTSVVPALRKQIKRSWDQLADEFLQLSLVREQDSWSPFDLVDGLERALKFSKRRSLGGIGQVTRWSQELRGVQTDSFAPHALLEEDFRNRRARHIVYGHTHSAETIPLDASYAEGYVLNQVYFNAGTWQRVYRPTQWAGNDREFIPLDCMTYLAFFTGDERGGRSFETWSGTLATDASDCLIHRLDAGRPAVEAIHNVPTARVPVRSPHFQRPAAQPRTSSSRL
jgi:hypothetical protein